jgi:predicted ester cyclase
MQAIDTDAAEVVERFILEVLTAGGPARLEEVVWNAVLRQKVIALRTAFPDLRAEATLIACDGDMVAVHATATGTHCGFFQGVPPTARRWSSSFTAVYRIADGRIVDFWENWDLLGILEQLGGVRRVAGASA